MARHKRVHDGTLTIRASQKLIDEAREAAHQRGMSLSEAMRQLLRNFAAEAPVRTKADKPKPED